MRVHVLGIGGTLMGSVALLAKAMGYEVTGSDQGVYPPMSSQLAAADIRVFSGYQPDFLQTVRPDCVIVGNAISRGNPALEAVLQEGIPYQSAPAWLSKHILSDKQVLAFAGTHGKTTTSSMAAWILEKAGFAPGFLIGGIPENWGYSAQLGQGPYFVIEADEYDTAFFDKQPKFMHYRPTVFTLLNAEFDHADIYADLASILQQFHYGIRLVPPQGTIVYSAECANVQQVIQKGCWSQQMTVGLSQGEWTARDISSTFDTFTVYWHQKPIGTVTWKLLGQHNITNALAAIAACCAVGVLPEVAVAALNDFQGVRRRMTPLGQYGGVHLFEDFAHHPTAIKTTLAGMKVKQSTIPLVAVIDFRSNTMKAGKHALSDLHQAFASASQVYLYEHPQLAWDIKALAALEPQKIHCFDQPEKLVQAFVADNSPRAIVLCSNGSFDGLSQQLVMAFQQATASENHVV